jgi:hypothetical protein
LEKELAHLRLGILMAETEAEVAELEAEIFTVRWELEQVRGGVNN